MRHWIGSAAAGAALALLAASAGAQGPGRGGPPLPPQMRAKFQAWQKWRGSHQNVVALQQTLDGLQDLERDPQTRLNKKQAGAVLSVFQRWRSQPALTDTQARQAVQQIKAPLNRAQIRTLAMSPAGPRGFGGPPPSGPAGGPPPPGGFGGPPPAGGGPGAPPSPGGRFGGPPPGGPGGPPPGGVRPGGPPPGGLNPAAFPSPKDYNPLNPNTLPFKRQIPSAKQRLAALTAALSRAK